MIPNCAGCQEEWDEMIFWSIKRGLHVATTKEKNLFEKKHFFILMVDDKGKIFVQ